MDPPSDPLIYIGDETDDDIPPDDGSISIKSSCNNLENGLQYILPYGIFDDEMYPLLPVM